MSIDAVQESDLPLSHFLIGGRWSTPSGTETLSAPFGGMKSSGIGREAGPEGLDAYVEHKSIYGSAALRGTEVGR